MDFWDLTKMLFRRWYVAAPLLLGSVVVLLAVGSSVKPDYGAEGHVLLIPPAGTTGPATGGNPANKPRNPWMDLGLHSLAEAVAIQVRDRENMETLVADGYVDNFTLAVSYPNPLISIEAVGQTPEQATGTIQRVVKLIDQEVAEAQKQYGVGGPDSITTLALDQGESVTTVTSKVKRVLLVVAGIGVLFTAAATIAADAYLRRRARRRSGPPAPAGPSVVDPKVARKAGIPPAARQAPAPTGSKPKPAPAGTGGVFRSAARQDEATPVEANSRGGGTVSVSYRPPGGSGPEASDGYAHPGRPDPLSDPTAIPADATIVLPSFSEVPWAGDDKGKRKRR